MIIYINIIFQSLNIRLMTMACGESFSFVQANENPFTLLTVLANWFLLGNWRAK